MADTAIEWASKVWNPVTGCDRVSPGCDRCYALIMAKRLKGMGSEKYQRDGDPRTSGPGFGVSVHLSTLTVPLGWKKPERIFVNSMSDLFHAEVPDEFIAKVWAVMALAPQHTFQVLTKRHGRMRSLLSGGFTSLVWDAMNELTECGDFAADWPLPNVHLIVTAEDQKRAEQRIPALLATPAAVRGVSLEPLLGPIVLRRDWLPVGCGDCNCDSGCNPPASGASIDWVIAGGESGHDARPMHPNWVRALRDQCTTAGVPFHFKQWGVWAPAEWSGPDGATHAFTGGLYQNDEGEWVENFMRLGHRSTSLERDSETPQGAQGMRRVGKKAAGRTLDGRTWDQYPTSKEGNR